MTIHDNTGFHATMTPLPGGTIGLLSLTRTDIPKTAAAMPAPTPKRTIFNVIFDNSGSMGVSTQLGLQTIVKPLLGKNWFDVTHITLFDNTTASYTIHDEAAFDKMMRTLPRQGTTNITRGVQTSLDSVVGLMKSIPAVEDVHVMTMLLTDGAHNDGPALSIPMAQDMKAGFKRASGGNLFHTVLAFCLTSSSQADLSMMVKEVFETAKIASLPNVFYANTHGEMAAALDDVLRACDSVFDGQGGSFSTVALPVGAELIVSGTNTLTQRFTPMQTETFVVTLPKDAHLDFSTITVDGAATLVTIMPMGSTSMSHALEAVREALQPLARQAVAFSLSAIERRLQSLEALVATIDEVAAAEKTKFHGKTSDAKTPNERRAVLKRVISAQYGLHEIRNVLAALRVRSRSNSDSISLLTGNQKKFAHIASKRSGTEARTPKDIAMDTVKMGTVVAELIACDLEAAKAAGIDLEDAMTPTSITLQNNMELLEQWLEAPSDDDLNLSATNDEGIMDVLTSYGLAAYPVRLVTCDATQVDLLQMTMPEICTQVADSASMMLSWRMNSPIKFADGNTYTELLMLVDPAIPLATTHVLANSLLVQHLLSAMVSKDLYMYLPGMHTAMHTHGFLTAVNKAVDLAPHGSPPLGSFLKLALHVIYSARKLQEAKVVFDEMTSFQRWLFELASVTRSPADSVMHPALLSIKLAISHVDMNTVDDRTALLNQLNEHLSRRLSGFHNTYASPAVFAQKLFDVRDEDAPHPSADPLDPEPSETVIRERCPHVLPQTGIDGVGPALQALNSASVRDFVESEWLPLFRLHQFTLALQQSLKDAGTDVNGLCRFVERHAAIPDSLVSSVQIKMAAAGTDSSAMWEFLGVEPKKIRMTCAATVIQACLYPASADRVGVVNEKDVTDPVEQRQMVETLYYLHYRVACGVKAVARGAIIGDVTAAQASVVDVATLDTMIGVHTHGHCRKVFWGMLKGLLSDEDYTRRELKLGLFRSKSSQPGFKSVLNRVGYM